MFAFVYCIRLTFRIHNKATKRRYELVDSITATKITTPNIQEKVNEKIEREERNKHNKKRTQTINIQNNTNINNTTKNSNCQVKKRSNRQQGHSTTHKTQKYCTLGKPPTKRIMNTAKRIKKQRKVVCNLFTQTAQGCADVLV